MSGEHTELRAERLRVTLSMFGVVHTDFASAYEDAAGRMSGGEHALFQSTTAADLELSNACLDVEAALRRREWAALESLLAAIPTGGDLDSVFELPAVEALGALRAAVACGWFRQAGA
jgi:hypothetical protein